MRHVLVAAFDRYSEAEQTQRELLTKGLSQSDVQVSATNEARQSSTSASGTGYSSDAEDESIGDKISSFFRSVFGEESRAEADVYHEAYKRGAAVVTVTVKDDAQLAEVEALLTRNGAVDIDEKSASWGTAGTAAGNKTTTAGDKTTTAKDATDGRTTIPVMEEQLKVGKRAKNLGRVRVVSHVTEQPVDETVSLSEQHAVIERHRADRAASPGELDGLSDRTVEIQETAEEPVVEKSARVVEEIEVGTDKTTHDETIHDTVRRSDVRVDRGGKPDTRPRI